MKFAPRRLRLSHSRALAELRRQLASVEYTRFDLAYSWLRYHEGVQEEP